MNLAQESMASEQKLPSTDDNQTTGTSGDSEHPPNVSQWPSGCASDYNHQGEPVTQPKDRKEQVEGIRASERNGGITGGEQVGGDRAGKEKKEKVTGETATCENAAHQVNKVERSQEVPVGLLVSVDENSLGETGPQVIGERTVPEVTGGEQETQVTTEETCPLSTGEGTGTQETAPQATIPEIRETVGSDEERDAQVRGVHSAPDAQVTDTGVHPNPDAQVKDTGVHPNLDAQVTVTGVHPNPDAQVTVTGVHPNPDAQVTDTGVHPNPDAQVTVTGVHPDPDAQVTDTGVHLNPDTHVTDTGVHPNSDVQVTVTGVHPAPDAQVTDTGVHHNSDVQVTDTGVQPDPDAQVTDTGVHPDPDAQVTDTGVHPDPDAQVTDTSVHLNPVTQVTDTGVHPNSDVQVTDTGVHPNPDAQVTDTGVHPNPDAQVVDTGGHPNPDAQVIDTGVHPITDTQMTVTSVHPDPDAQVTVTGVHLILDAQLSGAGEKWIDTLVHNIVTEVTGEGVCTGEHDAGVHVSAEAADTRAVMTEEEEHSSMQETGMETMTGEQVTLQGAGAAVQVNTASTDNTDIASHVSGDGVQVRAEEARTEQVSVEAAGIDRQVEASRWEDSAGAQVTTGEVQDKTRSNLEASGQVIASGEEADREVTPDLDALPGREGTLDQDQPVACREKEWPSLICTASEVRTVTEEQGDSQQGSDTPKEPSDQTPEMKEREMIEDGYPETPETPIEREIRLAMEREMSLRQERGISSPIGQPELVEVRRRTISVEPVPLSGKERQLAGAQMLREIQLETQREQDLVELGKVMGTYDRGAQQELQERKMIFESMNTEPSDAPIKKKQSESQYTYIQQQPVPQEEAPPLNIPILTNYVAPARETRKGPSYAEANGSNVIIIEHSSLLRRSVSGNTFSSAPADSRRSTPADYYRSAPADSRRSTPAEISRTNWSGSPLPNSVDSPVPPGSPYQLLRSPSPRSLLEKEIEEVNERERELQRLRSSIYGRDESVGETTGKKEEITTDVQSVYQPERPNWGKLEVNWPPNKEAAMNGQGLDSPRTRRQRSTLIQSWESGNPNPKDDE
ncbi:uncharacterized protein MISP3 [Dendropsophus ebraccatus]|uniref:uncharacterized protein MISP3 n=1 Tax=Dendropsophus ebraccatus TaxID=150705 RepID=UPI003831DC86